MSDAMHAVARGWLDVRLLAQRRAGLLLTADLLWLLIGFLFALADNGRADTMYPVLVLIPFLILGVPVMSEAVELERRGGTLDLALSSPGARWYFQRRIASLALLMFVQGAVVIVASRLAFDAFPLSGALVHLLVVSVFLGCAVLYWSLRLRGAGAPVFATYITTIVLGRWFYGNAIRSYAMNDGPMAAADIVDWCIRELILATAALLFYLYAVRLLRTPERILN